MLRTRENSDVFNSLDEIYLVFTSKKQISSIYTFKKNNVFSLNSVNMAMARSIIAAPAVKERLLVAAIDFGTTYSGYAYSFRADFLKDPLKIATNQWQFGSSRTVAMKTPSCILFNSRRQCDSFGFDAENKYAELCLEGAHHEWFFFRYFKMLLYRNKVVYIVYQTTCILEL